VLRFGLLCALLGCAHGSGKPAAAPAVALDATPQLPSPNRGGYGSAPSIPKDPLVAKLVAGRRWDEALSGAATAVALGVDELGAQAVAPWFVREARYRSGYPWTVMEAQVWSGPRGAGAPPQLTAWLAARGADQDLGVVHARGRTQEHWVALAAVPDAPVPAIARRLPVGAALELPASPGWSYALGGPEGDVSGGDLAAPSAVRFDASGEWVLSWSHGGVERASIALYVGVEPPSDMLLEAPVDVAPRALVVDELNRVRAAWGGQPIEGDAVADVVASALLADPTRPIADVAAPVGLAQAHAATCPANALMRCLDELVWSVQSRAVLARADRPLYVGLATNDAGRATVVVGTEP